MSDERRTQRSAADASSTAIGIALWIVVGFALVYGIVETVIQVTALFG